MSLLGAERTVKRLRKDEYIEQKEKILGDWRSTRIWFVPDRGDIEYIILMFMGRSRRRLSKNIRQYKFGSLMFTEYSFGKKQAIHVEQCVKKDVVTVRFHNIDVWTRFHIMRELLMQEKRLVYTIETYISKLDSLYIISRLWMRYVTDCIDDGYESVSLGRWMTSQLEMKKLIMYRSVHATRDDLRVVDDMQVSIV